ncbi:hypothetical protein D9M71_693080 [compost metagenome]
MLSTTCTSLLASTWSWNGGLEKCAFSSVPPASRAAVASGWGTARVYLSRRLYSLSPHCLAAAYCRKRDCTETPTAGRAMRSFSLKSVMVFTLGLLLTR